MILSLRSDSCRSAPAVALGLGPFLFMFAAASVAWATGHQQPDAELRSVGEIQNSFTVDMVVTRDGETFTVRRTVDGPKARMDVEMEGQPLAIITLGDQAGTTYMLMPSQRRAIKQTQAGTESRIPERMRGRDATEAPESETEFPVELLGQETIDGRTANKYGVQTEEGTGLMWIDAERELPLRMEADGAVIEFKNYLFHPQEPKTFLPPTDYEVMDMDAMMAGMGGMPGLGGMAAGLAGGLGGSLGGSLGSSVGGAFGGPLGSMLGEYVGQRIGSKIGGAAAGAITKPK